MYVRSHTKWRKPSTSKMYRKSKIHRQINTKILNSQINIWFTKSFCFEYKISTFLDICKTYVQNLYRTKSNLIFACHTHQYKKRYFDLENKVLRAPFLLVKYFIFSDTFEHLLYGHETLIKCLFINSCCWIDCSKYRIRRTNKCIAKKN